MVFITAIRTDSLFFCLTDDYRATRRKREVFPGPHSREKVEQDLPLQLLTLSGGHPPRSTSHTSCGVIGANADSWAQPEPL